MKIGKGVSGKSAICGSNSETIVVRGRDLCNDLVGRISLTEHLWLLVTGELPSEVQRRVLDATLVAIAEHGLVPSVVAARATLAAAPEALQGAVAAGLLGCGSVILGAAHNAGIFLSEVVETPDGAQSVSRAYHAARRAIPGYGHPLHKGGDPRAERLLRIAKEVGSFGRHCVAAREVESLLPEITGRNLVMNVSSAIPAVLLDVDFPLIALKGVPLVARAAGLVGHLTEEQSRPIGFMMAHAGAAAIAYDGPAPAGFVPDEG
jgi:citrate synthase